MKPSTGKNHQVPNKKELNKTVATKELNKDKPATTIQNYFKNVPKSFVVEVDKRANRVDDTRTFYIEALNDRLKAIYAERAAEGQSGTDENEGQQGESGDAVVLANEKFKDIPSTSQVIDKDTKNPNSCNVCEQNMIESQEWEKKCQEWEKKYNDLKKTYLKTCHRFTELELKHNDLTKTAFRNDVRSDIDVTVTSSDGVFTPNEIRALQSIPLEKTKDSTFILKCIEYAYKSDPSVLIFKTLKGTPEWIEISEQGEEEYHAGKDALTPKKVVRIKELFVERVAKGATTSVDFGDRIKDSNINRLISSGIKNVAKKQK